jgi:hypothetical protein
MSSSAIRPPRIVKPRTANGRSPAKTTRPAGSPNVVENEGQPLGRRELFRDDEHGQPDRILTAGLARSHETSKSARPLARVNVEPDRTQSLDVSEWIVGSVSDRTVGLRSRGSNQPAARSLEVNRAIRAASSTVPLRWCHAVRDDGDWRGPRARWRHGRWTHRLIRPARPREGLHPGPTPVVRPGESVRHRTAMRAHPRRRPSSRPGPVDPGGIPGQA